MLSEITMLLLSNIVFARPCFTACNTTGAISAGNAEQYSRVGLRLALCERALATGSDELRAGAIECFAWWRHEGFLPDRAWQLLNATTENASPRLVGAMIRFVQVNDSKPTIADWDLLATLPVASGEWQITHQLLECATDLLEKKSIPSAEVADRILNKLDHVQSLDGGNLDRALSQFAMHFPGKVFLMIWRRHQLKIAGESNLEIVPYDFDSISFSDVLSDPGAAIVIQELQKRLIEGAAIESTEHRVLQIATMQSGVNTEPQLFQLLDMALTGEQLKRLADFAIGRLSWPIVLECPEFTRKLLMKARAVSLACHQEISRELQSLPGSRGTVSNEPNEEWMELLAAVEEMAEKFADDPELGPLYAAAAKYEREWIADMRKSGIERERSFEDETG
ncbi:MAG: hypothetical protein ACYC67_10900 [Prosthecobacter sp.]